MAKKVILPNRAQNIRINRGITMDPDNPEWTDADFAHARPARELLPSRLYQAAVKRYRGQRGPQKTAIKKPVTLRLDADIVAGYRATGPGWQSRMNDVLRKALIADQPHWTRGEIAGDQKPLIVEERGQSHYRKRKKNPSHEDRARNASRSLVASGRGAGQRRKAKEKQGSRH